MQHLLPQLRLDDLLDELQTRLQMVLATRDQMHGLLDAVVAVGSELNLEIVLRRIVEAAATLVDARYGALGVIGEGEEGKLLAEFVPVGLTEEEIAKIHHWPEGHGILGLLVRDPGPLRLPALAEHHASSGFPAGHPTMKSFLGVPVRVRGEIFGNLYLTEKRGGGEFTEDDEAVLSALGAAAGVAIENARLYDEARRQQRWLEASAEVTTRLLSGTDPGEVLAAMTGQALELSGADLAVLALPADDGGGRMVIEYASGDGADGVRGFVLPITDSLSGKVLGDGKSLIVDDFVADPRTSSAVRDPMSHVGPAVVFPLGVPGNVRGVLTVGRRRGGMQFPPEAADVVASFAAQAGVALELADRRRDAERLSLYEDRDRIARDLHDLVIQRLYATGMSLEGSMPLIARPELRERVRHAVDAMDDTIKDIRGTIFALQSRSEDKEPSVRGQVLGIVDEMAPMLGFAPAVRLGSSLDSVTAEPAGELLAALREALSNAARHAGADRVEVSVEADGDLTLRVVDNGVGIAPGAHRSGLANLAKRAERLGGSLRVGNVPVGRRAGEADLDASGRAGPGTELVWRVPLG